MSRLFEKNVEKLLTYCTLGAIIINCITIACIMEGFLRMKVKNRRIPCGKSPYRYIAGRGKIQISPK